MNGHRQTVREMERLGRLTQTDRKTQTIRLTGKKRHLTSSQPHLNLISQQVELTALTETQKTYTVILMTIHKHLASSIALYYKRFTSDDRQFLLSNRR